MKYNDTPLVIGGTGGSGTRVVSQIVRDAGYFMGSNLNAANDALEFKAFYDRWVNVYLEKGKNLFPDEHTDEMVKEFQCCMEKHLMEIPRGKVRWGWKNPRSLYLLPFFHGLYPGMKFIHVIRDGRDMAYSKNQSQLRKHGIAVLTDEQMQLEKPLQSLILWSRVNMKVADYGEMKMQGNYLRVRFRDLCDEPKQVIRFLFEFIEYPSADLEMAASIVSPPKTIGRSEKQTPTEIEALNKIGASALRRFGYQI